MSQKKAFVRYAQNKAVPGSLIVRTKAPKVGTWKEVPYDVCCGGSGGCEECIKEFIIPCFEELYDGTYSNFQNFVSQGYGQCDLFNLSSVGSTGMRISAESSCGDPFPQRKLTISRIESDLTPPQNILIDNVSLYNITLPFIINNINALPHNNGLMYLYDLQQVIIPSIIVADLDGNDVTLTNVLGASIKIKSKQICETGCVVDSYLKLQLSNIVPA